MVMREWCPASGQAMTPSIAPSILCPTCGKRVKTTKLNNIVMRHKYPIRRYPNKPFDLTVPEGQEL